MLDTQKKPIIYNTDNGEHFSSAPTPNNRKRLRKLFLFSRAALSPMKTPPSPILIDVFYHHCKSMRFLANLTARELSDLGYAQDAEKLNREVRYVPK